MIYEYAIIDSWPVSQCLSHGGMNRRFYPRPTNLSHVERKKVDDKLPKLVTNGNGRERERKNADCEKEYGRKIKKISVHHLKEHFLNSYAAGLVYEVCVRARGT